MSPEQDDDRRRVGVVSPSDIRGDIVAALEAVQEAQRSFSRAGGGGGGSFYSAAALDSFVAETPREALLLATVRQQALDLRRMELEIAALKIQHAAQDFPPL